MKSTLSSLSSCTIVVIGDVILDVYFMGTVGRLSPEAPVPIVLVKEKSTTLGGAGNVALNVTGLGCRAVLLGVRGNDVSGERLSEIIRERGIYGTLLVDASRSTTSKTRIIGQGQQLLRLDEEETSQVSTEIQDRLLAEFEKALGEANAVILSDYDKGVLNDEIPGEVIRLCRARGVPVFVDPKRRAWERFQWATCITPNTSELEAVAGSTIEGDETLLVKAAEMLRERYQAEQLLVTRGAKGMCLVGRETPPFFITATAREVFDVSGAGDTVIATMAAGVASGMAYREAAELANVAAGIVVGKIGSQPVKLAELEAALRIEGRGTRAVGRSKVTSLHAAQMQVKAWQASGEKIIYVNGHFDVLHPGHIHFLSQARELGDRLVVEINTDDSFRERKGRSGPTLPEQDRAYVLSALDCVDLVVPGEEEGTPSSLIEVLRPDVLVTSTNSQHGEVPGHDLVQSYGGRVHFIPLPNGYEEV